jgi:NTE family protein
MKIIIYDYGSKDKMTTTTSSPCFENLVLEGGGAKITAYVGCKRALEERGLTFKRIAGSSAGAICAGAFAVGYTADELEKILLDTDMTKFQDDTWGWFRDFFRMKNKYGLYRGDYFLDWYGKLLEKKTGNKDITLKEVQDKYGVELVLTGTCLNKVETHFYHPTSNPHMPVRMAARISMSIPVAYVPVIWDGDMLVDGGFSENYPIWVFDKEKLDNSRDLLVQYDPTVPVNKKTLGIKLVSPEDKRDNKIYHVNNSIDTRKKFFLALLDIQLAQNERLHIKSGYWDQTITVSTGSVGIMDFAQTEDTKKQLIKQGYDATEKFLRT